MRFYKVDVFTNRPLKGNPATVVLGMPERMRELAYELNVTETVFVEGDRFRYFTPTREIELCGHATIGALHVLRWMGRMKDGIHVIRTNAGRVEVEVGELCWMKFEPRYVERDVVDVGVRILLREVRSFDELMGLEPRCDRRDVVGVLYYTLDSDMDACLRFFAPHYGIPEDPVTGTACAGLAFHLRSSGKLVKDTYVFEQGHALGREGIVYVRGNFWVGGDAVCVAEGEIRI